MQSPISFPEAQDGVCPLSTADLCWIFVQFGGLLSGKQLYDYQLKVAYACYESVLQNDGSVLTAEFCRQSGKSEVVSTVVAVLMALLPLLALTFPNDTRFVLKDVRTGRVLGYAKGFKIGCFGPKKEQADIIYNRVREFLQREESKQVLLALDLTFTVSNGKRCALTNGSLCDANTASEQASIEGGSYHLLVTDETQKIADQVIRKSILPMGASVNATVIHLGTASIGKCYFYVAIQQNKRAFALGGIKRHYEVDYKEAAEENAFYAKYIATQKQKLGEGSDEFKMAYCNCWILERGQFIDEPRLKTLNDYDRKLGDYAFTSKLHGAGICIIAAIDFAKQHDRTVLSLGVVDFNQPTFEKEIQNEQEWRVISYFAVELVEWVSFEGDDYESQYRAIMEHFDRLPLPLLRLCLDATGCGASIADRFVASLPDTEVIPYVFGLQSKDALYRNFMRMIRAGEFRVPANKEARDTRDYILWTQEMLDLEKAYSNGLMVVHHPDEAGCHDDYPDSGALLAWAGSSRPSITTVEQTDNNLFR